MLKDIDVLRDMLDQPNKEYQAWVTDFASAMGLAAALRMGLINAAREKVLAVWPDIKFAEEQKIWNGIHHF